MCYFNKHAIGAKICVNTRRNFYSVLAAGDVRRSGSNHQNWAEAQHLKDRAAKRRGLENQFNGFCKL